MRIRVVLSVLALLAAATCSFGGTSKAPGGIEFTYDDPAAYSVSLAGSFNNWDMRANPMTKDAEGTWRVVVALAPGKHEYKFVVNGSDWLADPDNPKIVGDYGNSEIEITSEGDPVISGLVDVISNTAANARVMINGWFRGTYSTRSNGRVIWDPRGKRWDDTTAVRDPKWRLSRPQHEMYVSFNPTIGSNVKGSATIRLDSGIDDIREITADLYAGWLAYKSDYFDLTAYHNEEIIGFDDPLETIGHIDLPGTIWDEDLDFGRGTQGVILDLRLLDTELRALYSNVYDDDIYNSEIWWLFNEAWKANPDTTKYFEQERYDNVGTDVLGLRAQRSLSNLDLGFTLISERNGWWVGFEEGNQLDSPLETYRLESGDYQSTWFEAGTSELLLGADVGINLSQQASIFGEYASTSYEAKWDAGNRVRKQGSELVDGDIDVLIGDEDGSRFKAGFDLSVGPHRMKAAYETARSDGMRPGEAYVTHYGIGFETPDDPLVHLYGLPFMKDSTYVRKYTDVNGIDQFIIYEHDALPERTARMAELNLSTQVKGMELGVDLDVAELKWDYPAGSDMSSDITRLDIVPSVGGSLFDDRWTYSLIYRSSKDNISGRMPSVFDVSEFIAKGNLKIRDDWGIYYNVRHAGYDWSEDGESHDTGFTNPHFAFVWHPVPSVEIRLGYGLNPIYYRDTPVDGREIGRERYVSSYLWLNPEYSLVEAERALEDLDIITLMGVISF
jgi:hypothetical protein